ncbi:MAG: class I adenylate-forming enzyme family protein, partial [Gammaproteobacteria bacterium]
MKDWWEGCAVPSMRREAHFGDRVVRCFTSRARSLHELFASAVARHGEDEALVCAGARWSWRGLDERVGRVAGGLREHGVTRGDRVVLFVSNRPEFVVALFAIQRLGAIAVPVGTREQRPGLSWIIGHCGARAVFHDAELADRLPEAGEGAQAALLRVSCGAAGPAIASVEVAAIGSGTDAASDGGTNAALASTGEAAIESLASAASALRYSVPFEALEGSAPLREAAAVREEDPAVILYTSGTTGKPKGAMLTHLNIVHSAMHFAACMQLSHEDRSLLAVPASHVTGLIANIVAFVSVGGAVVMMPSFKAREFLDLAAGERITHTLMVPAMYNLLLLQPDLSGFDLAAWRLGGYGGAPMPVATIDALAARLPGLVLLNAYGATETTSPTTMMPAGLTREHADSVGVALPCAEVLVVDDEGCELPPGEAGELWITGPMVVRGYWNDAAATAREFTAGWWHSGDLGSVDADGFVRVFDRKKDMLNRGGYKIYSVEVENVIASMPGVVEAAVVGRPCPVLGERVHVFVHAPGVAITEQGVRAFCAERLADYKVPET